jgi:hypothetical protein
MPRGSKNCVCGTANGPRSFSCKSCGKPFVIKGVEATAEQIAEAKLRKAILAGESVKVDPEQEEEYLDWRIYFDEAEPTQSEIKTGGETVECYLSKDRKFRIRFSEYFMGVSLTKLHNKWYTLLVRNDNMNSSVVWDLVKRFNSMNSLLHFYRDILNGTRELRIYIPGDDAPKSRVLRRIAKRNKKLGKRGKRV